MVEYDKNTINELNRWFDQQAKSDFPIDQIKKSLLNNGYDASFVDTFIAEKTGEIPAVPEQQITNDFPETQKSPQTPVSDTPDKNNPWQNNAPTNEPTANLTEEQKSEKFKNYSYFDKVKLIITKPKVFFDEMPTTGGYKGPVLFAATNYFIGSVLSTLFCLLLNPTQITYLSSLTTATGINPYILIVLMIPLLLIIYVVLGIFLGGTILNMFFRLFKGHGTREGTIRVISYISAIMLLTWIPYIGGLIGLYGLYIALKGYSRIHKISEWRVFFALLAPLILISIIIALMGMSFIWMIAGNQNDVQEQIQQDITQLDTKMSAQFSIES
ncbi:MAG: YIP1 family protein, partial [Candidatus Aenigmarchaeota archaeon]|nr:YIP1 family protein [Candidatus Aenigmarchaeota archaeon]